MNKFAWNIFRYHAYILQSEEYDLYRYLRTLGSRGLYANNNLRKTLVFTKKLSIIFFLGHLFIGIDSALITLAIAIYFNLNFIVSTVIFFTIAFLLGYFSFIYIYLATLIIKPIEAYFKNKIIKKAKFKIKTLNNVKIIGITGSYGKTSMKDTLFTILSEKLNVVRTEGNNNTPLGISRTILNKINSKTEVFIVEMGEYVKGDVKQLCEIAQPDISIISGINEAHLERYGSMENAISTKFEIAEFAKEDALILLNADDELTMQNYEKYTSDRKVRFFGFNEKSEVQIKDAELIDDLSGSKANLVYRDTNINLVITPIADYFFSYLAASLIIASEFGMSPNEFRFAAKKIAPADHRLEVKKLSNGGTIIDDSYNGNSDGVKYGIELLSKITGFKRKIYATPGLAETGYLKTKLHEEIAEFLFKANFNKIFLIKNSAAEIIQNKLKQMNYDMKKVRLYENSNESWKQIYASLETGDLLMIQNDLSDIYV